MIPHEVAARVAHAALALHACAYGNPRDRRHDHFLECVNDHESEYANQALQILTAVNDGDEDRALNALTRLLESVDRDR